MAFCHHLTAIANCLLVLDNTKRGQKNKHAQDKHEMDRAEFKEAIAILIDTTLKRVGSSFALALLAPWIAPYIVDIIWFFMGPAM